MKLLNLGCGATRPQGPEWTNVDNLRPVLAVGTPERTQLDSEPNYVNADITQILPFANDNFDGLICSHVIEHFDCQQAEAIMRECRRVLRPGGILLVSVPDATIFRNNYPEDTPENAERLFGEPIHLPDGERTFFGYALWNRHHKAIIDSDVLWCYFMRAGFDIPAQVDPAVLGPLSALLNRRAFSLVMVGRKQ